jgi:hypothetical protein
MFRYMDGFRPRHRMNIGGTWELPFGKGRKFMGGANKLVDAVLGGWTTSGILWYYAGNRLHFGQMEVVGDAELGNPDKWGQMFNPDAFAFIPQAGFKVRDNPRTYNGVQGPGYKNLDVTLAKFFKLSERIRLEIKMEAYNLTNTFSGADPNLNVTASTFGRVTAMAAGTQGREFQYNIRLHF